MSDSEDFEFNSYDMNEEIDDYYNHQASWSMQRNSKKNEDRKLLKKSSVGYLNQISNGYFSYKWTINNIFQFIKSSETLCLESPEFKTGTNNGNAWILKLIISRGFFSTNVQLHLISCKDPSDFRVYLSLLNAENKKIIKQSEKSMVVDSCKEGKMVEFSHFISDDNYFNNRIPINKLTLLCEIIHSSTKSMKITKNSKSDDLKLFLSKEVLSDVTISVGETKFHLHKAILASRSAVFLAMFQHDTKENRENLIEITDVKEKIMKKIILYIYTDEIENLEEDVCHILAVADKYGMEGLKLTCIEELNNSLASDNVFQILVLADTYNAKQLKINALKYIALNLTELIDSPGYKMVRHKYPHFIEEILLAVAKRTSRIII